MGINTSQNFVNQALFLMIFYFLILQIPWKESRNMEEEGICAFEMVLDSREWDTFILKVGMHV